MPRRSLLRLRAMWRRLKGWRTLVIFSPPALLGLLDAVSAIDLSPIFVAFGVPEPSRAAIVTGMSLLAIGLRVYTTTPPGQPVPPAGAPR